MVKKMVLFLTAAVLLLGTACGKVNSEKTKTTETSLVTNQESQITLDVKKDISNKYYSFDSLLKKGDYEKAKEDYDYIVGKNKNGKYDEILTLMNTLLQEEYTTLAKVMQQTQWPQETAIRLKSFETFSVYTERMIKQVTDEVVQGYLDGSLSYDNVINYLNHANDVFGKDRDREDYLAKLPVINESKLIFEMALSALNDNRVKEGIKMLETIPSGQYYYQLAQEKIAELNKLILAGYVEEVSALVATYDYAKAVGKADEYLIEFPGNETLLELKEASQKNLAELYEYTGPLYHVFFHSLIVYKEKAFDGDYKTQGYNYWMTTTDECKKILEQLYERNYILYDIRKLITTNPDGTITKNKIMVPKGKKPIILSIDDVSYYGYMEGDGFAKRLVIDDDGKVANLTIAPDGKEVISREHDVMPMVDKFVEEHPDFSFQGAKGIVALTGYEGVLGYATNNPHEKDKDEMEKLVLQAKKVADAMKANGWLFSSHSYTHADTYSDGVFELSFLKTDTERWKKEVTPIIGETNIYITPFGYQLKPGSDSYHYLIDQGFNILCAVGGMPYVSYDAKAVRMDRQNLDGFMMHYNKNLVKDLIDADYTIDKDRPAFPKNPW